MANGFLHVLHRLPQRYTGVVRNPEWGMPVYEEKREGLPPGLEAYRAPRHSLESYVEDQLNGTHRSRLAPRRGVNLHPYQKDQTERIAAAYYRGAPGYFLAFPTGSGKTPIAVRACSQLPGARRVLVITRLAVTDGFREGVDKFGPGNVEWIVVHPEQLYKLFQHPTTDITRLPVEQATHLAATDGSPRFTLDAIVCDESHLFTNPESIRTTLMNRLRMTASPKAGRVFTLWQSATPFSHPGESGYVADLLAYVTGQTPPVDAADYGIWLRRLGFRLRKDGSQRWYHEINPADCELIEQTLYRAGVGATATARQLGLPHQERQLAPIAFTPAERADYEAEWLSVRERYQLSVDAAFAPQGNLVKALREVQKASLIKIPHIARMVVDLVKEGNQVVVVQWFRETVDRTATEIIRAFEAHGLPHRVVVATGENSRDRERRRQAFQLGVAQVIITNVLDGINLHAGEQNVGGRGQDATTAPRVCLIADVLTGGKRCLQAEGRTQRDGLSSLVLYAYAEGTTEERWLALALRGMSNTQALTSDPDEAGELAALSEELETKFVTPQRRENDANRSKEKANW